MGQFIPPLDLTHQYRTIQSAIEEAVGSVLSSGRYIGGEAVASFEQSFQAYIGTDYCVACNSGTDALYLALKVLGLKPGDEVITTPFTFFATAEVISRLEAIPVFVDIDPYSLNLNLDLIEEAITPKTRAILPVHLFGHPINMSRLGEIARHHHLALVEDCAQATGATWGNQKIGSFGDLGCFSFFPTKNLGACGDGGAVVTSNPEYAKQLRQLREHGSPQRYYHSDLGLNSRLDAIQATILAVKLQYLDRWNEQRRQVADRYQQGLKDVEALQLPQPVVTEGTSVWHQYTLQILPCGESPLCEAEPTRSLPCAALSPEAGSLRCRDWVKHQLDEQGIKSMVYYPMPLHQQEVYQTYPCRFGDLRVAEQTAQRVLSLPMFPELTVEQQDYVIQTLKTLLTHS